MEYNFREKIVSLLEVIINTSETETGYCFKLTIRYVSLKCKYLIIIKELTIVGIECPPPVGKPELWIDESHCEGLI